MTLLFLVLAFLIGLVVGAYSHKWLAKETGAPANLKLPIVQIKPEATVLPAAPAPKV